MIYLTDAILSLFSTLRDQVHNEKLRIQKEEKLAKTKAKAGAAEK
jgi:hypothetical protein